MNSLIQRLARPAIRDLKPYSSARSLTTEGRIFLDANENPWGSYNRYPQPQPERLRTRLAELYGVSTSQLFLGRGTDEAIDTLLRTFCESGRDAILICPPTYGVYEVAAGIQGARVVKAVQFAESGFDPNPATLLNAVTPETKLVFLCSPNNPTGNIIPESTLEKIAESLRERALVIIDEAYIDFSDQPSFSRRIREFPNVVVLRTLSKAWGLAGLRCGVAIGDPELIELMQKVRAPYPFSAPSIAAALTALDNPSEIDRRTQAIVAARKEMATQLSRLNFVEKVFPSEANFLLLKVKSASEVIARCREQGIVIRDRSSDEGLANCVRISVGSPEENQAVLQALGAGTSDFPHTRSARVVRETKETKIEAQVNLDTDSTIEIATGIGFFDHMLDQLAKHASFGLRLKVTGDLCVDEHHTVEDSALALGEALRKALGDKKGIGRYGFVLPMDEAEARVSVDLSGRAFFVFRGSFPRESVGGLPTELVPHFFRSLADGLGAAIHIEVLGENAHHMIESTFKGIGRALRPALAKGESGGIPSTKGVL